MKTLKDLRKIIINNGGELKIGALKLTYDEGKDVNIFLDTSLVMWVASGETDRCLLADVAHTVNSDVSEAQTALEEKREGRRQENKAQEAVDEANKKLAEAATAIGKVEAYEKMLIGRTVSLGQ